jgi:hypothetical protein
LIFKADIADTMNENQAANINIGNEKIGIGMIAASLVVILITVGIFLYQQKNEDISEIHRQGAGLVRLLGSMSVEQLTGEDSSVGMLRVLEETQVNRYFAYSAVVAVDGASLAEFSASAFTEPVDRGAGVRDCQWH